MPWGAEQIDIFEFLPGKSDFPCDNCIYDKVGCCNYPDTFDDYCVLGDKKRPLMKNVFWKYDKELGIAFFCPSCKTFICLGSGPCPKCGQELDWKHKDEYKGAVKWE